jgi:hypothetical protein
MTVLVFLNRILISDLQNIIISYLDFEPLVIYDLISFKEITKSNNIRILRQHPSVNTVDRIIIKWSRNAEQKHLKRLKKLIFHKIPKEKKDRHMRIVCSYIPIESGIVESYRKKYIHYYRMMNYSVHFIEVFQNFILLNPYELSLQEICYERIKLRKASNTYFPDRQSVQTIMGIIKINRLRPFTKSSVRVLISTVLLHLTLNDLKWLYTKNLLTEKHIQELPHCYTKHLNKDLKKYTFTFKRSHTSDTMEQQ